jgi:hypothetical protein
MPLNDSGKEQWINLFFFRLIPVFEQDNIGPDGGVGLLA